MWIITKQWDGAVSIGLSVSEDNPNTQNWIKIKNPAYSQKEGRGDLVKRAG